MKNIVANDSLVLLPGQLISVTSHTVQLMRIDCGRVWVTIAGDSDDYWLFGGDSLLLAAARHVVIEADKAFSRIDFLPSLQADDSTSRHAASDRECLPATNLSIEKSIFLRQS